MHTYICIYIHISTHLCVPTYCYYSEEAEDMCTSTCIYIYIYLPLYDATQWHGTEYTCDLTCIHVCRGLMILQVAIRVICRDMKCMTAEAGLYMYIYIYTDMQCIYIYIYIYIYMYIYPCTTPGIRVTRSLAIFDTTHPYAWHDSFIVVTWLIYFVFLLWCTAAARHWIHVWHDACIRTTCRTYMFDVTISSVRCDSLVSVTWHVYKCNMSHLHQILVSGPICMYLYMTRHPWPQRHPSLL